MTEVNMAKEKKPKTKNKPLPPDAVAKGPNREVPAKKLPSDCAG